MQFWLPRLRAQCRNFPPGGHEDAPGRASARHAVCCHLSSSGDEEASVNTYELLRSGQRHVQCLLPCLAETQQCEPRRRRMLLGMMLDRVRDQGRVARCIYGPLLRQGVDPNLVLATFQSQAAVEEMLVLLRGEVSETRCWLGALILLRCLVQEHFDNQEAPLRRGVGHFYGTDPEV